MPITISGSTGISGVDGTASSPALQGADTNTGVYYPAVDQVAIATGGVQRLLVGASGAVTTTAGVTIAGTLSFDSGYGSAAAAYGCRAWVNFDGTTNVGGFCTIRASGNVTSVADNGTGLYTINFTTAMPDINYAISGLCLTEARYVSELGTRTTSNVQVVVANATPTRFDNSIVMVAVFR